ncbi:MAG: GntR family transcriptional regulator [Allomuricauda sp.]|nr:MAG: GntR family transcriptional regulator [Allomuricauda sp.]
MLRDRVKEYLLKQIQRNNLQVGKTINLAALARQTQISVTPIREALSQLEESQLIKSVPNRGFIVPELTMSEAKNLYETVSQLEILALESAAIDERLVGKLKKQQLLLQQAHSPLTRLNERFKFHDLLVENCQNTVLMRILDTLKSRIRFYEQLLVKDASFYENSDNQNEGIIRAIEEQNIPTAALILKMNWMLVSDYVVAQLQKK